MGETVAVVKILIVPAVISLLLFLLSTYVLYPLWQRWRSRYSHYLPLDTLSTQTSSLRARVQHGLGRLLVPANWRARWRRQLVVAGDEESSDRGYGSEDGEELGEFVDDIAGLRRSGAEARRNGVDDARRLSRDLEEGFMDDSDEESEFATPRR